MNCAMVDENEEGLDRNNMIIKQRQDREFQKCVVASEATEPHFGINACELAYRAIIDFILYFNMGGSSRYLKACIIKEELNA